MISISSLAQRFRPRPAVLPSSPAIIPLMACQQPIQPILNQHHQAKNGSTEISTSPFSITSYVTNARSGHIPQPDSANLVSDPILGSSNARLTSQETAFGSLPTHILTPIVSLQHLELLRFMIFLTPSMPG